MSSSDLEASNRQLAASNADLEQFAYVASHDLQEPLRSVTRFVQLLQRRYGASLDEQAADYITRAVDGAKRMHTLIESLLEYARVTRGGDEFAPVDCERVLQQVLDDLAAGAEEAGATITHDPLPTVLGDSSQIAQVLTNLIGNAIKFHGEDPPRIHVGVQERDDEWEMSVRDNGIGIDEEYMEQIFVIFQRLHGRTE